MQLIEGPPRQQDPIALSPREIRPPKPSLYHTDGEDTPQSMDSQDNIEPQHVLFYCDTQVRA